MASKEHNKYGPGYAAKQVKHHEWRTAENSAAHLIPHLKKAAEKNPQLKLLDVGAGSGTISASLAKYMPSGQILATDISDDILERAKEFADSKGVKNISFQKANIYELPFPDASFDVTHASQVLCHLDSPCDAIKEMVRVTRSGGIVALRETDMRMWSIYPELPALLQFHDINVKTIVANGGQDKGGRSLLPWALKAGVAREHITLSFGTWCYSQQEDKQAWSSAMAERLREGQMRGKSVELGLATEKELDNMAAAWEKWSETDDASLGIMNGELIIKKA